MTRHQRWSAAAHIRVIAQRNGEKESQYRTLCMKMPGLIKQAGLVQALVFMKGREQDIGNTFVSDLSSVYGAQSVVADAQTAQQLASYLALTSDISQISIWFRRFAQIELRDTEER